MQTVWAALPIVAILVLMLGLGWSAARAGLAALALAVVLAVGVFGFGAGGADGAAGVAQALAGVGAEGGFIALTILWILWPALALHQHQQDSGALQALRAGLARLSPDPRMQALWVGWCLTLFLEGAAGFGTPVALAAPLLVGLGVAPLQAVLLALLGHAVGVSFGALGTPVAAQVALTGLEPGAIAWRTAVLNAAVAAVMMGFFVQALAQSGLGSRGGPGGVGAGAGRGVEPGAGAGSLRVLAGPAALALLAFVLPSLALASWLGPELPTLGGALAAGAVMALGLQRWAGAAPAAAGAAGLAPGVAASGPTGPLPLPAALAPYAVLVGLVLATRAVPALADTLGAVVLQWRLWDTYAARMQPLVHPGTLLLAALVLGTLLQRRPLRVLGPALAGAARRLLPVSVALLAMLCLSRLMLHAGMIDALQQAAVQGLGRAWPLVAPAVGALGSFVTGSATASNVLFTPLQVQTAQALGLAPAWMAAAQGLGAGIGNIVCPHNIVAGAATVGLAGREAEVLRRTMLPAVVVLALGGVLAWAVMRVA
jgi:lactate permease